MEFELGHAIALSNSPHLTKISESYLFKYPSHLSYPSHLLHFPFNYVWYLLLCNKIQSKSKFIETCHNVNSDMKFLCTDVEDHIGSASITSFHEAKV